MITIAKNYSDLPANVMEKMGDANVFFTANYFKYKTACGEKVWYAYNDMFVMPIDIYEKIKFRYAMYPSEYYEYEAGGAGGTSKAFLNQVQVALKREKVAWITSGASAFFDVYPTKSMRIPFGSHVINLNEDIETLWAKVHTKHRNSIRKAEKNGVVIKAGGLELLNDYCRLDKETWHRNGRKGYGISFFENILCAMKENAILYMAYKDDIPQAGACYYINEQMCYYMYGASADHPESGATNYLHWEVIKSLKEQGIKKYSFVGCRINEDENSKYHSIQRFKERFGGELVTGYMFKVIICPWQYRVFQWLYKLKNKTELTDAIDQEISKWKELNYEDSCDCSLL